MNTAQLPKWRQNAVYVTPDGIRLICDLHNGGAILNTMDWDWADRAGIATAETVRLDDYPEIEVQVLSLRSENLIDLSTLTDTGEDAPDSEALA